MHALDYLLKPFSRERFKAAAAPARARRSGDVARRARRARRADRSRSRAHGAGRRPERLVVRDGGRVLHPCRRDRLDRERGNYLRIHVGSEAHLLRGTIKGTAERLDPEAFLRISRSTIVNLDRVRAVYSSTRGELVVVMRDGTQLPTTGEHGRRLRDRLKAGL